MRKWRVWLIGIHIPAVLCAANPPKTIAVSHVTPELRASLSAEYTLDVVVQPHDGDAWTRLAKRVAGDAERWKDIAAFNGAGDTLSSEQRVRIPFSLLRPELQRQIATTLFPADRMTGAGWRHVVVGTSGVEGESLWNIAEWFTGSGANYVAIRKANPGQGLSTRRGDVILIPRELLAAATVPGAESSMVTRARLRAAQALDVAGKREEALTEYKTVLARPNVFDSHDDAKRGLKEPYRLTRKSAENAGGDEDNAAKKEQAN